MEFMIGLCLVMFMVVMMFTTLGKAREAQYIMASRRQAIFNAETQLARMQVPGSILPTDDPALQIEPMQQASSDERYTWVRVTVKHDGQQASLIGLIRREYLGGQP